MEQVFSKLVITLLFKKGLGLISYSKMFLSFVKKSLHMYTYICVLFFLLENVLYYEM